MAVGPKGFNEPRYRALIANLVEARRAAGLSQEALAEKLQHHQQFVSRYEIGERRLDVVEFTDIAAVLGLDAASLVAGLAAKPGAKS